MEIIMVLISLPGRHLGMNRREDAEAVADERVRGHGKGE